MLDTNQALHNDSSASAALVVAGIVAATTVAGVLFAELRRRTGSLAAPALLHWTITAAATLASHLVQ